MSCREVRDRLMAAAPGSMPEDVSAHVGECLACAEFGRRLDLASATLRDHQALHLPDAYFARRVSATIAADSEMLGWAAVRLLPATLALTLILSAWCWLATPGPTELGEAAPTDDLLAWVIGEDGP